jgi:spermidine synthase
MALAAAQPAHRAARPAVASLGVHPVIRRWPILGIFILSGAAGLVYEVVWARQLVLVFGNTTQAISAILTGFFGGMAIGSAIGGRIGDRVRRPLRMYGLLELILVVIVLATPVTFRLLHEVYRGAFATLEGNPGLLALVRFGLSLLALGPATVLMGATLPTLTRYLSRGPSELSGSFSKLYAANTIGAIVGTIAAGFVLIELLGLTGTLITGATCSAIAGVVALLLDRGRPAFPSVSAQPVISLDELPPPPRVRLAILLAFVSGLTSLGYQVLWTRLLASGTGNSTYVFSTILAVFLVGLAGGALFYAWLRPRIRDVVPLLALGQVLVALLVTGGMALVIARHTTGFLPLTTHFDELFTGYLQPVVFVVLPATFVMGLTFPAASALVADPTGRIATNAGLLLAANTTGAIVATFLIPFLAIPSIGSPTSVAVLALVNASVGVLLALAGPIRERLARLVTSGAGIATVGLVVLGLIGNRVFVDPNVSMITHAGGQIAASREDEIASVQAGQVSGFKQLWVTGSSMTVLTVDAKLMPILPLMLRPASSTALTVAFGMGTAYRASLIAGLHTDAIELVPSVPGMFSTFYGDAEQVLSDPRGRVIVADGRNHVELTDRLYDIVVVDPPPPIESSGVSVISSLEFYRAAKARLNPGGVMMQWVPYGQTLDEFKAHVRTFRDVYPNVIVAQGPGSYGFYMLGSEAPIAFDDPAVRAVLARPGVLEDISSAYDSPYQTPDEWAARIPRLVRLAGDQVARFTGPGPLITDDRPMPEYFLLRHTLGPPSPRLNPSQVTAP